MKLKKYIAELWANLFCKSAEKWRNNSMRYQEKLFQDFIESAKNTKFGKDHNFSKIKNIKDFQKNVPVQDYEKIAHYIEMIKEGQRNILWKGKPIYLAKTSGTTSGTKYIPITKESMPFHIKGAKSALFYYINNTKKASFVEGKMIFLQGNPTLIERKGIKIGRLSGISAHYVPAYLQKNRMPSWKVNCIEDWETKIDKIVEETLAQDMTLISGIPPWMVMYFEKIVEKTSKTVQEVFPNLQLLVTGGVNYEPYKDKINELIGKNIDVIQTYPASEGFLAYQDQLNNDDLLLCVNHGIFYEFIPLEELNSDNPIRLTLQEVELNKDYAVLLTTNAGLWAYEIGDTVRFTSKKPYRIVVSGRTKHFTSAFGEHVIAYEVEEAMKETISQFENVIVKEFTLAPEVNPKKGLPYHEWFIEFDKIPLELDKFQEILDISLRKRNTYYDDLIIGKILQPLKITIVDKNGFNNYMKKNGKLGGQNKLPRLANDRNIVDNL